MGKTRASGTRQKAARNSRALHRQRLAKSDASTDPAVLLVQAAEFLQTGQPDEALLPATQAVQRLETQASPTALLPGLTLLAEIQLELGDAAGATATLEKAVEVDPEGLVSDELGGGAEKFLYLAQLSEEGGRASLAWLEKGAAVLQRRIEQMGANADPALVGEARRSLASALCAMIELWMTDLSFETEAESQCESLIQQALTTLSTPDPSTLQTLASIRISQSRVDEARAALQQSLALWIDLPPAHPDTPDFALRISLARLLMEANLQDEALTVAERLTAEDDLSVEAWYLGGWCLHLLAHESSKIEENQTKSTADFADSATNLLRRSRRWLQTCLQKYKMVYYEDQRLQEHANELVTELNRILGESTSDEESDEDDWEDDEGLEDGADSDGHACETLQSSQHEAMEVT